MKLKRLMKGLMGLALVGMAGTAWADIPSDSFTLTVTPSGNQGVIINTTTFDFGSVALGSQVETNAIPVTSTGSVGPVEYEMSATIAGGWSLSTDGTSDAQNELVVRGLFNSTAGGSYGSGTTDLLTSTPVDAGDAGGEYEGDVNVDSMALNTTNNLFVRFDLPSTSSFSGQQTVTVTVTGEPAN